MITVDLDRPTVEVERAARGRVPFKVREIHLATVQGHGHQIQVRAGDETVRRRPSTTHEKTTAVNRQNGRLRGSRARVDIRETEIELATVYKAAVRQGQGRVGTRRQLQWPEHTQLSRPAELNNTGIRMAFRRRGIPHPKIASRVVEKLGFPGNPQCAGATELTQEGRSPHIPGHDREQLRFVEFENRTTAEGETRHTDRRGVDRKRSPRSDQDVGIRRITKSPVLVVRPRRRIHSTTGVFRSVRGFTCGPGRCPHGNERARLLEIRLRIGRTVEPGLVDDIRMITVDLDNPSIEVEEAPLGSVPRKTGQVHFSAAHVDGRQGRGRAGGKPIRANGDKTSTCHVDRHGLLFDSGTGIKVLQPQVKVYTADDGIIGNAQARAGTCCQLERSEHTQRAIATEVQRTRIRLTRGLSARRRIPDPKSASRVVEILRVILNLQGPQPPELADKRGLVDPRVSEDFLPGQ